MKILARAAPQLRVRRNYPYLGRADGLPTATRRRWPQDRYIGFELELNQKRLGEPRSIIAAIATSLRELLATNGILK